MSFDLVSAVVGKALDGLFMRQAATANNVANAASQGYAPMRVDFEDALRQAAAWQPGDTSATSLQRIAEVTPQIAAPLADPLGGVKLDEEISIASETAARYAMLTGMLDRTLQLQQLAVKGA
jgi:flagellar basal-body rod protein FlgB